ncbi:bifunctional UDP-N-acetylglucosamine diphosphorylase/glucosamine-1-phosphate N-acetyltransferase GlmU [Nitrosomonas supralitoralis]|uniref:Bifunctional protein GlmU n=1 Tax=Nitrosomonas supralitoralis TaxID=2116706 RepID=A0A2P7NYZ9_9PROT|nr:bifunctional UDP-N-acetylglucosamine diphosphorylase/glucosamine-1-phosphate N-acetyltransferase GlmU [Nitrosomonas supralitoralis]PSJ18689.1 UDP-N-acetylglucosamine diphosphorylase/glucosamine-1-phosphate N-acetyltransferase [Nitrosomonas supralitoralis]
MLQLNIVILAAGAGKRMHSSLPKVLHTLADRPLLAHVINTARMLSPSKIFVIIGHDGEKIKQSIIGDDLRWIIQKQQLGTGHAVMQALPQLDHAGLTLILYGDVPLVSSYTLRQLVNAANGDNCVMLSAILENPFGYGRVVRDLESSEITAIVEQKDASVEQQGIHEINTGIMLIPNAYLHKWLPNIENNNTQLEYYLTDIIALAVKSGVSVISSQAENFWEVKGVNNKCQLAELERLFQQHCANKLLDAGVSLIDPARIDIRGELLCGSDVEIDINCIFEGTVKLGNFVRIGANCILKNVTVASGSIINPFSMVEDAEIGENCKIGPYARIRPGTRLASKVQIGNFVEVKNSQIGTGSKANHLSYIGDSGIGKNVNIGAGTITCNYDGVNKHHTIIEDDVFIGSDTQLIAPVKISKGTTIGAGSTITKETPENQLTLSRSKQISVVGWRRPKKQTIK